MFMAFLSKQTRKRSTESIYIQPPKRFWAAQVISDERVWRKMIDVRIANVLVCMSGLIWSRGYILVPMSSIWDVVRLVQTPIFEGGHRWTPRFPILRCSGCSCNTGLSMVPGSSSCPFKQPLGQNRSLLYKSCTCLRKQSSCLAERKKTAREYSPKCYIDICTPPNSVFFFLTWIGSYFLHWNSDSSNAKCGGSLPSLSLREKSEATALSSPRTHSLKKYLLDVYGNI